MDSNRSAGLDGLRGFAAVAVVIYQAINLCDLTIPTRVISPRLDDVPSADWPARLVLSIFNAEASINIFFIISGLVLSASLQRERRLNAATAFRFVLRRIARIYPALIFTILAFGAISYVSLPALFVFPFSPTQMLFNSLLLEPNVNGETWTLQVEMLMVPAILFIVWLQRRLGLLAPAAFVVFALIQLFRAPLFGVVILHVSLVAFALGMLIATDALRLAAMKVPAWLWGPCVAAIALERFFAFGGGINELLGSLSLSALAVALIFYRKQDVGLLCSAPLGFLGRISYSLYLWHAVVMYVVFPHFQTAIGADKVSDYYLFYGLAYGLIVLCISIPLASFTERLVERPFIAASRMVLSPTDFYGIIKGSRLLRTLKHLCVCLLRTLKYLCVEQSVTALAILFVVFLAANCISLATVEYQRGIEHEHILNALTGIVSVAGLIPLFLSARFSFGYVVGMSFYGVIAGFVWITYFSVLRYDHAQARFSAVVSLVMFLVPLLFQTAPLRRAIILSPRTMERFLVLALCFGVGVLALNAHYGFALVGLRQADLLRGTLHRPAVLNYITGSMIFAVFPFTFAYFALRRRYRMAIASIVLIVSYYPVLLNKTVLFSAAWLPFLLVMFRLFEPRRAVALSLLIPMSLSLIFFAVARGDGPVGRLADLMFGYINIRMFAIPPIAMDYYSNFFAHNDFTKFCQINIVRAIAGCAYVGQLGVLFSDRYGLGNFNASLFATEGIASVGPAWAPLSAFFCGMFISVGNNVSSRLPPPLIAVSGGLVVQALINVPLSVSVLSNGLFVLFLLWYVTPIEIKPPKQLALAGGHNHPIASLATVDR
jgi:peptidoglycan/LPS O-acetylase OafA/YrhL